MYYENFDLQNVVTPVDPDVLERLLIESNYDADETTALVHGFRNGFSLEYCGPRDEIHESENLKLTVGDKTELWNKIMKEVKAKRYAGPYKRPPFKFYKQSPLGLVPKDNGAATRLIFHLSHPRKLPKGRTEPISINGNTPEVMTSVSYPDLETAVRICLRLGKGCYFGKSDLKSAFRNLGIRPEDWNLLVMKAESPLDGETYYFVDKCLPFGASISCALFQRFSDALAHITKHRNGSQDLVNYLDDYFFVAVMKMLCDQHIQNFLNICDEIGFPVSMDKTHWSTTNLSFLGILFDSIRQIVMIPAEKIQKARDVIVNLLQRKKATIKELQRLTGLLNFFGKCIVPARAFTRRLYALTAGYTDKPHWHVRLTSDTKLDLQMWLTFLDDQTAYSRPFTDFSLEVTSEEINMYTDSSANEKLGCGGFCDTDWFALEWEADFITTFRPSINYLELYAVTIAVVNWIHRFRGRHIVLFCDNMSVVSMINNTSSKCKNCMVLIRVIVLQGLLHNVKISARHVPGVNNQISDSLSRKNMEKFKRLTAHSNFSEAPTRIPVELWPMSKIWLK